MMSVSFDMPNVTTMK